MDWSIPRLCTILCHSLRLCRKLAFPFSVNRTKKYPNKKYWKPHQSVLSGGCLARARHKLQTCSLGETCVSVSGRHTLVAQRNLNVHFWETPITDATTTTQNTERRWLVHFAANWTSFYLAIKQRFLIFAISHQLDGRSNRCRLNFQTYPDWSKFLGIGGSGPQFLEFQPLLLSFFFSGNRPRNIKHLFKRFSFL